MFVSTKSAAKSPSRYNIWYRNCIKHGTKPTVKIFADPPDFPMLVMAGELYACVWLEISSLSAKHSPPNPVSHWRKKGDQGQLDPGVRLHGRFEGGDEAIDSQLQGHDHAPEERQLLCETHHAPPDALDKPDLLSACKSSIAKRQ